MKVKMDKSFHRKHTINREIQSMLHKAGEMQPKHREAEKKMNEKLEGRNCLAWISVE